MPSNTPSYTNLPENATVIAVTGSPGTGKSTGCRTMIAKSAVFSSEKKASVLDLNEIIRKEKLYTDIDDEGSMVIDEKKMTRRLHSIIAKMSSEKGSPEIFIIDGLFSYLMDMDMAIVLRCNPETLFRRLKGRNYSSEKIKDNLMSEAIGTIFFEAKEKGVPVIEIDSTEEAPEYVAQSMRSIINQFIEVEELPEKKGIDWLETVEFIEKL